MWLGWVSDAEGMGEEGTWGKAWWGLVGYLEGNEQEVRDVVRGLEPEGKGESLDLPLPRSLVTHYLNVVEQTVPSLPDEYINATALEYAKPYLEDRRHSESFESAHSVVLAVFKGGKGCVEDLAPWYTELLLKSYPELMSASQLRLAFTTMTRAVSTSSDALAWWCILRLIDALSSLPITTGPNLAKTGASAADPQPTPLSVSSLTAEQLDDIQSAAREEDYDPNKEAETSTRLNEIDGPTPLEIQALHLNRGHLLLVLIDQVTAVNLVLLRSLLDRIWEFILEEDSVVENGQPRKEGKEAAIKVLFGTLGDGLDATKREEGVRWWLEKRGQLKKESKKSHL